MPQTKHPSNEPLVLTCDSLTRLPARPANAHKGQFGHVLVVGGDRGAAEAPVLAGVQQRRQRVQQAVAFFQRLAHEAGEVDPAGAFHIGLPALECHQVRVLDGRLGHVLDGEGLRGGGLRVDDLIEVVRGLGIKFAEIHM